MTVREHEEPAAGVQADILTLKPCPTCASPMEWIERGYSSCPSCFVQTTESYSGFWHRPQAKAAAQEVCR